MKEKTNRNVLLPLIVMLVCSAATLAQQDPAQNCRKAPPGDRWIRVSPGVIARMVQSKVLPDSSDLSEIKNSDVRIKIEIDKSGAVMCAQAVGGNPVLYPRTIDAASKWTFRPFLLDGNAINVESWLVFRFNKGKVAARFPES